MDCEERLPDVAACTAAGLLGWKRERVLSQYVRRYRRSGFPRLSLDISVILAAVKDDDNFLRRTKTCGRVAQSTGGRAHDGPLRCHGDVDELMTLLCDKENYDAQRQLTP
ncbi:hypothetical protein Bbelb_149700 [Branchiostoma belcheri]|nr:hypothetical protein Bbelb_149700 [Branchiostoma belcheri]